MWTTMMVLAAALVGAAENTDLRLELTATKTTILVGEPLKVHVVWSAARSATQPVAVSLESVKLMVDDGTGFKQHIETQTQTRSVIRGPSYLAAGESRPTTHVLSVAGGGLPPSEKTRFRFAFPQPGHYRVKAEYFGVNSNVAAIEVKAPKGDDAELYAKHLRARPELLTEWALMNLRSAGDADLAVMILDEYEDSPYVGRLRVLSWVQQIDEALSTHYELHGRGKTPLQGAPAGLLQRIEADTLEGPFDEDRLVLVARKRLEWGDRKDAARLFREIRTRHPGGQAADDARVLLSEIEASLQTEQQ